jgi:hypothetical protein
VTCNNPTPLAPNASTTLNLNIAAAAPTSSAHSPTVTVGGDPVSSNNSTSVTTNVVTPAFTINSAPASPPPGTQAVIVISMSTVLSHEVTGKLTLRFTPDAVHPADDPAIQFATGGREVVFTVPANGGQAQMGPNRSPSIGYQTGTVAGRVTFDATLETGSNPVTVSTVRTISRRPPTIQSVRSQRMSDTVNLLVNSSSTPREITAATLTFLTTPAVRVSCGNTPGCTAATNSVTLDVKPQFDGWFSMDTQYGSTNTLVVPLSIQGNLSGSISVTLRNAQGNSNSMSIPLP